MEASPREQARHVAKGGHMEGQKTATRVLVVDDDEHVRRALVRALEGRGHDVVAVTAAEHALTELRSAPFDAVLSDISMPGMDGLDLLRALREHGLEVPIVLVTGRPNLETATQALELGAVGYLTKPVELARLRSEVDRAVALGRLARAKREAQADLATAPGRPDDRAGLEATFERCLSTLWVAFQPILGRDGVLVGYEALLRSREPALPDPGAVLGAAEKLGAVERLGRHVRAQTALASATVTDTIFVNLHASDLFDDELFDTTRGLGAIATRVVLEITERAALGDMGAARERAVALRGSGYRVAIDDLGAGYAGLSSFTALEPDVCKLDMSLVRDVHLFPKRRRLVESMTSLCRDLEILVVAEGVETAEELECLRGVGCDLFQGYLLARPGPPFPVPVWPGSTT